MSLQYTVVDISHIPGKYRTRLSDFYTRRRGGFIINKNSHILPTFIAGFPTKDLWSLFA